MILVEKPEGKRSLGCCFRDRQENNIKMYLKEIVKRM